MERTKHIEELIGTVLGLLGGWINRNFIGMKLMVISQYLPEKHALISDGIAAAVCAVVGFIFTKICHAVYILIKSKLR